MDLDRLLDVQDVDGMKVDPWNSSSSPSLFTQNTAAAQSSWTESTWMTSPAVLPPPPTAKVSAAPVKMDPWQSAAEPNERMYFLVQCFHHRIAAWNHF